jgi:hypothetical protein
MGLEEKKCKDVYPILDLEQAPLASPHFHDYKYPVSIPFKDKV